VRISLCYHAQPDRELAVKATTNRSWRRAVYGLAIAAGALAGCEQAAQPVGMAPPPVAVTSLQVLPQELPLSLEYAAQLRGVREVEVRARVSGILLERLYEEGKAVSAGDVLFRIDPAPFRAEAERARAELGVQQANLRQAQRERERVLPLFEQGLASQRDRDNAIAAYETAQAAVAAAEAAVRSTDLALSYTDVRAPIGGLTSREVRSEGSLITAGAESSLLAYIVQTDRLYVEFAVPATEAEILREALNDDAEGVAVRVLGARGVAVGVPAELEFISPRVDDATGTVPVRAIFDNRSNLLLAGQVVRARIEGVDVPDALVIPKRAVAQGTDGPYVWRIDASGSVAPQPIVTGIAAGNETSVVEGLAAGDRIVVDGLLKVQPGALVEATPIEAVSQATPGTRAAR
jgi:membrane fusion protein (multidrug efflux system)